MKLSEADEALRRTLTEMCALPESLKPFLIFEDKVTERFVQFAGSQDRFIFDVPLLGIVNRPVPNRDVDVAVRWAIETMRGPLRLPDEADVEIRFETTHRGRDS